MEIQPVGSVSLNGGFRFEFEAFRCTAKTPKEILRTDRNDIVSFMVAISGNVLMSSILGFGEKRERESSLIYTRGIKEWGDKRDSLLAVNVYSFCLELLNFAAHCRIQASDGFIPPTFRDMWFVAGKMSLQNAAMENGCLMCPHDWLSFLPEENNRVVPFKVGIQEDSSLENMDYFVDCISHQEIQSDDEIAVAFLTSFIYSHFVAVIKSYLDFQRAKREMLN